MLNDRQRRQNDMIGRAKTFFAERPNDFKNNTVATAKITSLTEKAARILAILETKVSAQGKIDRSSELEGNARDHLRDQMQDISDFAKVVSEEVPGLENLFRMPRGDNQATLIATGRAFAADAETHKDKFIAAGLPATFVAELLAAIAAYEQIVTSGDAATGERVGANAELTAEIKAAVKLVRDLSPIVRRQYRNNPANLAAWVSASHIERAPDVKPEETPTT